MQCSGCLFTKDSVESKIRAKVYEPLLQNSNLGLRCLAIIRIESISPSNPFKQIVTAWESCNVFRDILRGSTDARSGRGRREIFVRLLCHFPSL